jgi:hypothetical protein
VKVKDVPGFAVEAKKAKPVQQKAKISKGVNLFGVVGLDQQKLL